MGACRATGVGGYNHIVNHKKPPLAQICGTKWLSEMSYYSRHCFTFAHRYWVHIHPIHPTRKMKVGGQSKEGRGGLWGFLEGADMDRHQADRHDRGVSRHPVAPFSCTPPWRTIARGRHPFRLRLAADAASCRRPAPRLLYSSSSKVGQTGSQHVVFALTLLWLPSPCCPKGGGRPLAAVWG